MLLALVNSKPNGGFVYTSNIDGHFKRIGFDETKIVECHGSIHYLQCQQCKVCKNETIWETPKLNLTETEEGRVKLEEIPKCPNCGKVARPCIFLFADTDWLSTRTNQQEQNFLRWLEECKEKKRKCVVIEIGAGTTIPTVRNQSEKICRDFKCSLIRINTEDSQVENLNNAFAPPNISISLSALEGLDLIWKNFTNPPPL